MSWKKDWKRSKEDESRKATVMAWRNKNNHIKLEIQDNSEIPDRELTKQRSLNNYTIILEESEIIDFGDNKQELRSVVREWMEDHRYRDVKFEGQELKEKLIEVGQNEVEPRSEGLNNKLDDGEIETVVGTVQAYTNSQELTAQSYRDLTSPYEYRVFDWLGMMIGTDMPEKDKWLFEEMARIYIQEKSVEGLVRQLRSRDLLVDSPHY